MRFSPASRQVLSSHALSSGTAPVASLCFLYVRLDHSQSRFDVGRTIFRTRTRFGDHHVRHSLPRHRARAHSSCLRSTRAASAASEESRHGRTSHRPRRRPRARHLSRRDADQARAVLIAAPGAISMTLIGWLQIGLLFAVVAALVKPLGLFMARVFSGERTFLSPVLAPVERGFYAAAGVDRQGRAGLARLYARHARLLDGGLRRALRDPAPAGLSAAQSAGLCRHVAGSRLQHGGQLRHQHQLAVLWRRDDDEPFQPDGRADGAELRLRRHRHRDGAGADPRLCPFRRADGRQFLGRSHPRHALRAAAARRSSSRSPSSRWACRRRSMRRSPRPRSKARSRRSRSARSPARRRSSSSAPMAAASSTSTPRIRSRTRPRCPTISTSSPCSASRRRWSTPSARWSATAARAGPSSPSPASC